MQITVTDHNDWEGEDFSFILEVHEDIANLIKSNEIDGVLTVELNTEWTSNDVEKINDASANGYMDRINFYTINNPAQLAIADKEQLYENVFYKGVGLKRLS